MLSENLFVLKIKCWTAMDIDIYVFVSLKSGFSIFIPFLVLFFRLEPRVTTLQRFFYIRKIRLDLGSYMKNPRY